MNATNIRPARRKKAKPGVHPRDYSPAEDAQLKQLFPAASMPTMLAALPGRTELSIRRRATRLKLLRAAHITKVWPEADIALLRAHYAVDGSAYVAAQLNRTPRAVRVAACRMGFTTSQRGRPRQPRLFERWPKEQLETVRRQYAELGARTLAAMLDKPIAQIYACAQYLGVRRPPKEEQPPIRPWVRPAKKVMVASEAPPAKPRAPSGLKPQAQPPKPAAAVVPVKRSPKTPNLNAQKAKREKADKPTPLAEILTDMKRPSCPPARRQAFTIAAHQGMPAAIKAWDEWPSQQVA